MKKIFVFLTLMCLCVSASAQRKTAIVETVNQPAAMASKVIKRKVAIGRFSNETQYAKGIFYDKTCVRTHFENLNSNHLSASLMAYTVLCTQHL